MHQRSPTDDVLDTPRLDIADEMPLRLSELIRFHHELIGAVLAEVGRTALQGQFDILGAHGFRHCDQRHLFGLAAALPAHLVEFCAHALVAFLRRHGLPPCCSSNCYQHYSTSLGIRCNNANEWKIDSGP